MSTCASGEHRYAHNPTLREICVDCGEAARWCPSFCDPESDRARAARRTRPEPPAGCFACDGWLAFGREGLECRNRACRKYVLAAAVPA